MPRSVHQLQFTELERRLMLSAPPSNDDFSTPIDLPAIGGAVSPDLAYATAAPIPWDSSAPAGIDVWYRWTPATSGPAEAHSYEATFYQQTDGGWARAMVNEVTAGTTYLIRIWSIYPFSIYRVDGTDGAPRRPFFQKIYYAEGHAHIMWSDTADNEIGYRVLRNGQAVAELPPESNEYRDYDAPPDSSLTYTVTAYNDLGQQSVNTPSVRSAAANDFFANAQTLDGIEVEVSGSLVGACIEDGEVLPGTGYPLNRSVWFRWTAPKSGVVNWANTVGSTTIRAFQGSSLATLQTINNSANTGFTAVAGRSYYIRVASSDGGAFSFLQTLTPALLPAAPSGFSFADVSATQVQITWRDNSSVETGYRLEWLDGNNWRGQLLPANSTSATTPGANVAAPALFRIQALGTNADSPYVFVSHQNVLRPPSSISVATFSQTTVKLAYQSMTSSVRVYRRLPTETQWTLASGSVSAESVTVTGLRSGTTYEFRLTAYADGVESLPSARIFATTQYIAPTLTFTPRTDGVLLQWSYPYQSAGFRVLRYSDGQSTVLTTTNEMSYLDETAIPLVNYSYKLYAVMPNGLSSPASLVYVQRAQAEEFTVIGTDGDDLITVNAATREVRLNGDLQADTLYYRSLQVYAAGGNDRVQVIGIPTIRMMLHGGDGDDTLSGGGNGDMLNGEAGDDYLASGNGRDTVLGGPGADTIIGGSYIDLLIGDGGDDLFLSPSPDWEDVIFGGDGIDTMSYEWRTANLSISLDGIANDPDGDNLHPGIEIIKSGSGDDVIIGDSGPNSIYGGAGDDSISGLDGNDVLVGQAGNDTLRGNRGRDRLHGSIGDDYLNGGEDADVLYGDAGRDTLNGNTGADRLFARDGQWDRLYVDTADILDGDDADLLSYL